MKKSQYFITLIFCFLAVSKVTIATDSYYMTLMSYEPSEGVRRPTKDGVFTHTFATFARAQDKKVLEIKTISWGPCQPNKIRVFPPVDLLLGCNKNLRQSLDKLSGFARPMRAVAWGPIQISAELYELAVTQYSQLRQLSDFQKGIVTESAYEYAGVDWTERRRGLAKNCHHMVQDILQSTQGLVNPKDTSYGISAGKITLNLFRDYFITSSSEQIDRHSWVWDQIKVIELGNKNYPVLKFFEVLR
jgi:hypothetical protein